MLIALVLKLPCDAGMGINDITGLVKVRHLLINALQVISNLKGNFANLFCLQLILVDMLSFPAMQSRCFSLCMVVLLLGYRDIVQISRALT